MRSSEQFRRLLLVGATTTALGFGCAAMAPTASTETAVTPLSYSSEYKDNGKGHDKDNGKGHDKDNGKGHDKDNGKGHDKDNGKRHR